MTSGNQQTIDMLRPLGTPEALAADAPSGPSGPSRPRCNAHIHLPPNFSAFQSVEQAVGLARDQGIGVLGVSNYYDFSVYRDFAQKARRAGIFPLFGLEVIVLLDELARAGVLINDPGNPGKMYLCGKGITRFDPMTAEAAGVLEAIRRNDSTRMAQMTARLEEIFADRGAPTGLTEAGVIDMVVRRHGCPRPSVYLQERHLAQAFQEAFFARVAPTERPARLSRVLGVASTAGATDHVAVQNEIRSRLMKAGKPAFIKESFIGLAEARRLILELGGIPCYPTLADGASPFCAYEDPVEKLIQTLADLQIYSAELIPIRNKPDVLIHYVKALRAAGVIATGGTEHNTLDPIPLEPACLNGAAVPAEIREIFWEGARVVAAHQFLNVHGRCGYVDGRGGLNPAFATTEARIAFFRNLGGAVIERYFKKD